MNESEPEDTSAEEGGDASTMLGVAPDDSVSSMAGDTDGYTGYAAGTARLTLPGD